MSLPAHSSGIGAACAVDLAGQNFHVFAGVRQPADGERLRQLGGGEIEPVILDVTNPTSIAAALETVRKSVGGAGLAGLVNNAGIAIAGPLELIPVDALRRQLEVNVIGMMAVTQAFCRCCIRAGEHQYREWLFGAALFRPLFGLEVCLGGLDRCTARGVAAMGNPRFHHRADECRHAR